MAQRFPVRTAIAGLTALAIVSPAIAPANNTILAAAVAQSASAVTVDGPTSLDIKTAANFTATVPGATSGKVQFFLDGVLQDTVDVNAEGKATASITPKSYGKHTLVTRYVTTIDDTEYNVNPDGSKTFTTPFPVRYQQDTSNTYSDGDSYVGFRINGQTSSLDAPVELKPGETYTLNGQMTSGDGGRLYEIGFNPSPGSTYVSGSALKYQGNTTTKDDYFVVKTTANENGVTTTDTSGGAYGPNWGGVESGYTWPAVNQGYVGLQSTKRIGGYNTSNGAAYPIEAKFIAPDVPGIHVPQYASYKYGTSLHALYPMNEAAFKIAPKELPERNDLAAPTSTSTSAAPTTTSTSAAATSTSTSATPTTTSTSATPTTTSTSATPTTTSTSAAPMSTSTSAAPTTTSTSAAPTTTSTSAAPTSTSTSAAPTSTSTSAAPTSTSTSAAPTSTSTSAAPTSTSTSAAPTSTSTSAAPTSTSTSAAPTSTSTSAAPTNPGQTTGNTLKFDVKGVNLPQTLTLRDVNGNQVEVKSVNGVYQLPDNLDPKQTVVLKDDKGNDVTYIIDLKNKTYEKVQTGKKQLDNKQIGMTVAGSLLGAAGLFGSALQIPGLAGLNTEIQKQIGIFNPQLAGVAAKAMPVISAILGITGIGLIIGALVPKKETITVNGKVLTKKGTGSSTK